MHVTSQPAKTPFTTQAVVLVFLVALFNVWYTTRHLLQTSLRDTPKTDFRGGTSFRVGLVEP